jgi:putative flippase GtrA
VKFIFKKQSKFILVGIWNTTLGSALIYLFDQFQNPLHPQLIFSLVTGIVIIQSHAIMRKIIWHSDNSYINELVKFSLGYLPGYAINSLTIQIFVVGLKLPLLLVVLATSILLTLLVYVYQDKFTFKKA